VLACPVCRSALEVETTRLACANAHHFDRAREGYVNLLGPKEARGRDHGDDAEMVAARRRFLAAGHYDFLADALRAATGRLAAEAILDVGCGEGHFTTSLVADRRVGVDLSRPAIRLAARADRRSLYAVANAASLPVLDAAVELAVVVMGPVFPDELVRVLAPGGRALIVVPGARHLAEVRRRLYPEYRPHDEDFVVLRDRRFRVAESARVAADLDLEPDAVADLLAMTPYRWSTAEPDRARVLAAGPLRTPAEFVLYDAEPEAAD
jgi:23S rRNA (guanine745-N1)-methyltransferase